MAPLAVTNHAVAVNWGTSTLGGALLDAAGNAIEEESVPLGVLKIPDGDFADTLSCLFSEWIVPAGTPCLIAGSRQGRGEAPYVACPAGPDELARHPHWIKRDWVAIVSGLSNTQGDVPDVMRGEEMRIFGAMRLAGLADGRRNGQYGPSERKRRGRD